GVVVVVPPALVALQDTREVPFAAHRARRFLLVVGGRGVHPELRAPGRPVGREQVGVDAPPGPVLVLALPDDDEVAGVGVGGRRRRRRRRGVLAVDRGGVGPARGPARGGAGGATRRRPDP